MKPGKRSDTVTRRPNRLIIRERLSDGAFMTLHFRRTRLRIDPFDPFTDEPLLVWRPSLFIGPWEEARRWNNSKIKRDITGNGSLEGLLAASRHLMDFCRSLGVNETLIIEGADNRRLQAYRRLVRQHSGFTEGVDEDGTEAIVYRNPEYWTWEGAGRVEKELGYIVDLEGNLVGPITLPPKRNVRPVRKDLEFERDLDKPKKGSAERCSIDSLG